VVEATEAAGTFVPNDTLCAARGADDSGESLLLVTGPNMAGKSTYIRQTALLVLMSQVGSYVPARRAVVGIADKLFARVGASDELARGQSTFMVEMTEAARILNTATARSLVVLDEIGRGTSTYDGLSLAWSIVEYLHDRIGCRTLFATHYHELTELAERLPGVGCRNVMVQEHFGKIVFLHQIVPGAADRSYGIHVARLAGVPSDVSKRAEQILADLEQHGHRSTPEVSAPPVAHDSSRQGASNRFQLTLFATETHPVLDELRQLDVNELRPIEALSILAQWRERLDESSD
jgi:DNA mismatch repair protein MutS